MRSITAAVSLVVGVATIGLFLVTPRSDAASDDSLITQFTVDNVKSVIAEAGGEFKETFTSKATGNELVCYRYDDLGYCASIACRNGACLGVELVAAFGTKEMVVSLETVNNYNFRHASGKAIYVASNPSVDSARFLTAVGGITRANFVWEVKNFHALSKELQRALSNSSIIASRASPTSEVSYKPATPDAAHEPSTGQHLNGIQR